MGKRVQRKQIRKGQKMLYRVMKQDLITGRIEVMAELTDPAAAYDLAAELDAVSSVGDEEDRERLDVSHPCSISIEAEDEDGNRYDAWQECSKARCPSAGLLQ